MRNKPESVSINTKKDYEPDLPMKEGWNWNPLEKDGLLTIRHINGNEIAIFGK